MLDFSIGNIGVYILATTHNTVYVKSHPARNIRFGNVPIPIFKLAYLFLIKKISIILAIA